MKVKKETVSGNEAQRASVSPHSSANLPLVIATFSSILLMLAMLFGISLFDHAQARAPEIEYTHPAAPVAFNHEGFETTQSWDSAMRTSRMRGYELIRDVNMMMETRQDANWSQVKARLVALDNDLDHAYSLKKIGEAIYQLQGLKEGVNQLNLTHSKLVAEENARRIAFQEEQQRIAQEEQQRIAQEEQNRRDQESRQQNAQVNGDANVYTNVNTDQPSQPAPPAEPAVQQPEQDPILSGLEGWIHWNQNEPNWPDYTDLNWWNGCAAVSEAMVMANYSGNNGYTPDWLAANGIISGHTAPYSFRYTDNDDIEILFSSVSRYVNENPDIFHLNARWDSSFYNQGDFDVIRNTCTNGGCVHVRLNPNVIPSYEGAFSPAGIHSVVIVKVEGDRVVISDPGIDGFVIASVDEVVNAFRITDPRTGNATTGHSFEIFERIP